ncbi:hypothetical protein Q7P35_001619 [Cladosporium inversicolor]
MQHTLFDWEQWLARPATPSRPETSGLGKDADTSQGQRVSADIDPQDGGSTDTIAHDVARHSDSIVVQSDDKSSGRTQQSAPRDIEKCVRVCKTL